jgi:hypothetical protein
MTGPERSEIVQPNPDSLALSDNEALRQLSENIDSLWQIAGGVPGFYPFATDDKDFGRLNLVAYQDGEHYLEFKSAPVHVGTTNTGKPYQMYTQSSLRFNGTSVRYSATDYIEYEWRYQDDGTLNEAELDSSELEFNVTDELPSRLMELVSAANRIIPVLSPSHLVDDEKEIYLSNPAKQEEERLVAEMISTAAGALGLIQYVLLEKVASIESAETIPRELVFKLGRTKVTALEDPDSGEMRDHWQPDIVRLEEPGSFSPICMKAAEYQDGVVRSAEHMVTKSFFEYDGVISLEVDDTLWVGEKPIELVGASARFDSGDTLPELVTSVVRTMLRTINEGEATV